VDRTKSLQREEEPLRRVRTSTGKVTVVPNVDTVTDE
jgi:hypothetical protein